MSKWKMWKTPPGTGLWVYLLHRSSENPFRQQKGGDRMKAKIMMAAIIAVMLLPGLVQAQTPWVGVFFEDTLHDMQMNCPGMGIVDTVFVVAGNFNAWLSGIEYKIDYPTQLGWISDFDTPAVTLGTTPTGISQGWGIPVNAFAPVVVTKVLVQWNCVDCVSPDIPVDVVPHPESGFVRATDFPDYEFINGVGLRSLICSTVPTEETTWGQVKSLYSE